MWVSSDDFATSEPARIAAGDRWRWERRDLSDYPASTWTLTYALVSSTVRVQITAAANGNWHQVDVAAATTAGYTAGTYRWQAYVTSGTDRRMVGQGDIEILPNFATQSSGYDGRSHARTVLDAIEAVIEGRATKDQESYSIGGRSLQRTPIAELLRLRDVYRAEVKAEKVADRLANGMGGARRLLVRL